MMKPSGRGLLSALVYMVFSSAVIRTGGFAFGILLRRILGPQLIGIWNLIEIAVTCMSAITLGVAYSAERLLPQYRARDDRCAEIQTKNVLFTWSICEGVLLTILVACYYFAVGDFHGAEMRTGLIALPVLFVCQKLISLHIMLLRCVKDFRAYSAVNIVMSVLDWSLAGWAYFWGLTGVFIGAAIVGVVKLTWLRLDRHHRELYSFQWSLDLKAIDVHLPYGPKYSIFKAIWTVGERLDSLVVGYLAGTAAVAYYYLGFQLVTVGLEIPVILAYIAFPNLMESFALARKDSSFVDEFERYLRLDVFVVIPTILPLLYYGSEAVIEIFLPTFSPGIPAIKICILGIGVLAVRYLYYQVLMAYESIDKLIVVALIQIGLFLACLLLLRPFVTNVLVAVAISTYVASSLQLLVVSKMAQSMIATTGSQRVLPVHALQWCLIWSGLLIGVDLVLGLGAIGSGWNELQHLALRSLAFWLLAGPMCYAALGTQRQTFAHLMANKSLAIWDILNIRRV